MTATTLIEAAAAAALAVEESCNTDPGHSYSAGQSFYGVEIEALVGDEDGSEWVRLNDLDDAARPEVSAVRLFDCDGNRGNPCRTVGEIEAERARWMR